MVSLDRFMPGKKGDSKPSEPPESPRREPVKAEKAEETSKREGQYPEEEPYDEVEAEPEELEPEEHAGGPEQEEVVERTIFEAETPKNTGPLSLLSVTYSGYRAKALLKLYDPEKGRTVFWYDNTGHLPYCLTDAPLKEVLSDKQVASHPGFDRKSTVEVEKYDLLHDKKIRMTKVVAKDPLSIGGRGCNIRDLLQNSWEDNIRYHDCYIYDRGLIPGYTYRIKDGNLIKEDSSVPLDSIRERFQRSPPELLSALTGWFPLFISPVPDYRRVAVDIEVATEALDRIPDPSMARNQVICASLAGSDGLKKVLLLKRVGVEEGIRPPELPEDVQLEYFEDELALIKLLFRHFLDYPIVITFNGDNFDLHYLWRRAQVLGMKKEEVPIIMGREIALLPTGVHIDLYKFMHNHAIQIYAFGNSYREVALDAVASAFLNIRKIQIEKTVSELGYLDLASYCFRDSFITLRLTTENSNMVMNLITMIMRISRLSMEDVTRQGISRWIRSLFFFEHRARNYLIPRESDIEVMKGEASTTAVIKGKKYHGAIVIKPEPNVYFDVVVLDFASLYPSIIARWNLSYETVRCVHQSCRTNVVPDTSHWVCTKRLGLMALIIGLLKDVRVKWFKAKSKDPALTQEERDWYKVVQQALKVFLNACFTGDTDILTTNGVKNVKDINIGDKVINVNQATLEPEVDEVVETQVFDYNGDLLHFKNGRSTDLIVTPEHRFIVADHENGEVRFVTAEAIYNAIDFVVPKLKTSSASSSKYVSFLGIGKKKGWGVVVRFAKPHIRHADSQYTKLWDLLHTLKGYYHKGSKTFFIPEINDLSEETINRIVELGGLPYLAKFMRGHIVGKQNRIPARINLEPFAALCGWIISEGSLGHNKERVYPSGIKRGMNLHIDITQSVGKGNANGALYRDDIENVLKNIGVKYSIGKKGFRISNELLYEWVSNNCYTDDKCEECGFGHCSHRKRIPEILMQADNAVLGSFLNSLYCGDGTTDQTLYSTASEMLTSQLPAILAKLGFSSKRFYDEGAKLFRITWRNTNQHTDHWKKTKIPYNGQVYCITTKKNHTVFAGRNGRLIPCGQSYGVFGAEIFPLYCLSMADSTTAIGRHIITETIKKATESDVKVIYADSVAKGTRVFVDGGCDPLEIEKLFKRVDYTTADEKEYYYPNDLHVLSLDDRCKTVWSKVRYVMRHKTNKKMFRVWLTNSWHIDVTEDHSLIGYRNRKGFPTLDMNRHLVEVKPESIGKRIKSLVTIKTIPRASIESRNYPKELYELMGFFVGDGSFTSKFGERAYYLNLACGNDRGDIIGKLVEPLKNSWVRNCWIRKKGDITINGLDLVRLFEKELRIKGGKKIPDFIFKESEVNVCSFLRGLFSSDGTIILRRGRPIVRYTTTDKKLAEDIQRVLLTVSVSNSLFRERAANKYLGKSSKTHSYHVHVKDLPEFRRRIGFLTDEKNKRLAYYGKESRRKKYIDAVDFDIARPIRIEETSYDDYVYDLEVDGTHRFFANDILAHNTDSLFLYQPTKEQIGPLLSWAESSFGIDLEVDKRYTFVTFSGRKKNYLGVMDNGVVDIKGLMGKKRNTPIFIKSAFGEMTQVLKEVKTPQDFVKAKARIKEIVQNCYAWLKNRRFSLDELTFKVMLSRPLTGYHKTTPQHVKAAKQLEEKGKEVKPGDIISFVKVQGGLGVKPVQLARIDEIDVDKYVGHIESTFGQVLEALGIEFDEIVGIKRLEFFSQ